MHTDRLRLTLDVCFTALSLLITATVGAQSDSRTIRTKDGVTLKVETFVAGLEVPWSLAFTSSIRMLVTERLGGCAWRVEAENDARPSPGVLQEVRCPREAARARLWRASSGHRASMARKMTESCFRVVADSPFRSD
jgi:glucose/arabinose dehydrogenase